ncbi:hypothetical protein BH10BDE1_BH10BDE1_21140 [soil metagenome]
MTTPSCTLLLASAALLFGSFAYGESGTVADKTCAKLSGNTVARVCKGDVVESRRKPDDAKAAVHGIVTKIEVGVAEDGHAMGILTIQTQNGVAHLTTRGFVFVTPGTCVQDTKSRDRICMGETFKNERDGRRLRVTGFLVADGLGTSMEGVVVSDPTDRNDFERILDAGAIYDSHAVGATGKMTRYGSCDSEIPFLDSFGYGSLGRCATTDAAEQLKTSCSTYCAGQGQIQKGQVEATKPKCEIHPNMFPPHKKVCEVTITAKCECR